MIKKVDTKIRIKNKYMIIETIIRRIKKNNIIIETTKKNYDKKDNQKYVFILN